MTPENSKRNQQWTALFEVVICCGFPTQLLFVGILSMVGIASTDASGTLSISYIFLLSISDTILLLFLIFYFLSIKDLLFVIHLMARELVMMKTLKCFMNKFLRRRRRARRRRLGGRLSGRGRRIAERRRRAAHPNFSLRGLDARNPSHRANHRCPAHARTRPAPSAGTRRRKDQHRFSLAYRRDQRRSGD